MKYNYLTNTKNGHNKYYKMTQISATEWIAEYGKIGNSPQKTTYNMNVWDKKHIEKIGKGYELQRTNSNFPHDTFIERLYIIKNVIETDMQDLEQDYHKSDIKQVDSYIDKYKSFPLSKTDLQELNKIYKKYTT